MWAVTAPIPFTGISDHVAGSAPTGEQGALALGPGLTLQDLYAIRPPLPPGTGPDTWGERPSSARGCPSPGWAPPHSSVTLPISPTVFTPRVIGTAVARYNFAARDMRELSLREGDVVKIYSRIGGDQGWWRGETNGRVSGRPCPAWPPERPPEIALLLLPRQHRTWPPLTAHSSPAPSPVLGKVLSCILILTL